MSDVLHARQLMIQCKSEGRRCDVEDKQVCDASRQVNEVLIRAYHHQKEKFHD